MTDHCTVTRPGESTTDPDTGLPNTGTEQVYQGKCKVQTSGGLASEQAEGSAAQAMGARKPRLVALRALPYDTNGLRAGDVVEITESANPLLTGRRSGSLPAIREDARHRLPLEREGGCMNATSLFDAVRADRLRRQAARQRRRPPRGDHHGCEERRAERQERPARRPLQLRQQGIPTHPNHLHGEGSAGTHFRRDRPTKGGAGSLANIAFFGTAKGGGTHRFYEHGEEELPKLAEYVARAAVEGF